VLQISQSLRSVPYTKISSLQQQSQLLWSKYFSSFENIVLSTLQVFLSFLFAFNYFIFLLLVASNFSLEIYLYLHQKFSVFIVQFLLVLCVSITQHKYKAQTSEVKLFIAYSSDRCYNRTSSYFD